MSQDSVSSSKIFSDIRLGLTEHPDGQPRACTGEVGHWEASIQCVLGQMVVDLGMDV